MYIPTSPAYNAAMSSPAYDPNANGGANNRPAYQGGASPIDDDEDDQKKQQ